MPHAVRLMYEAIRVRMDGATCVAGRKARLSYRYLAEDIEVPAERGRRNGAEFRASSRVIEYGLELLMRAGLIERAAPEPMVYLLPVALRVQSARRNNGRSAGKISGTISGGGIPNAGEDLGSICEGISGACESAISGVPQRSDNSFSVGELSQESDVSRVAPTVAGALCARLRRAGVVGVQPHHPALLAALAGGLSADVIEAVGIELVAKGQAPPKLAYVVGTAVGRARDNQEHGSGTSTATGKRASSERAERAAEHGDELARRRVAGLGVITGGRAS